MSDGQDSSNVVISFRELDQVFNRNSEAVMGEAERAASDISDNPFERAALLAGVGQALRALEEADEEADPDVMTSPQDRMAALMQSYLAEQAEESGSVEALEAGGVELKFATNDVFGWFKSLFSWERDRRHYHPLLRPPGTEIDPLPTRNGSCRVALLADWGTGLYGAPVAAATIANDPGVFDLLMHLGDVYYSGTDKEVRRRFIDAWPRRDEARDIALNSNHEMYSGGHAFFTRTLPHFGQQSSYLALGNDHWLLLGLDTAYADHDMDDEQVRWLERMVAQAEDRKVILFSHHQPFSRLKPKKQEKLTQKLAPVLTEGKIFAWYWGHEHVCFIHEPDPRFGGLLGRCLGHGGMPDKRRVKDASVEERIGDSIWRRLPAKNLVPGGRILDGPNPDIKGKEDKYSPHGYMTLEFDGPHLREAAHTPRGEEIYGREIA